MSTAPTESFTAIYRRWAPRLFNHFRRLSWTSEDAADLTSEVFAIAWQRFPQLRDPERVGGWLWSIAHSHAANAVRGEQRRRSREEAAAQSEITEPSVPAQTTDRLRRALEALDDEARQLLLWREYSGLSYSEIAAMTGRTVESVRSGLYRARVQLRDEFSKRWE